MPTSAQIGRAVVVRGRAGTGTRAPGRPLRRAPRRLHAGCPRRRAVHWDATGALMLIMFAAGVGSGPARSNGALAPGDGRPAGGGGRPGGSPAHEEGPPTAAPSRRRLHPDGGNGHGPKPYDILALPFCELAQSAPTLEDSTQRIAPQERCADANTSQIGVRSIKEGSRSWTKPFGTHTTRGTHGPPQSLCDSRSACVAWPEVGSSPASVGATGVLGRRRHREISAAHRVLCTHSADFAGRSGVAGVCEHLTIPVTRRTADQR